MANIRCKVHGSDKVDCERYVKNGCDCGECMLQYVESEGNTGNGFLSLEETVHELGHKLAKVYGLDIVMQSALYHLQKQLNERNRESDDNIFTEFGTLPTETGRCSARKAYKNGSNCLQDSSTQV